MLLQKNAFQYAMAGLAEKHPTGKDSDFGVGEKYP